jgi:hypothetical protein
MWVHLKASISFEAESHDATQICRAAAEILHGQTPFQYHLTARLRHAAPARKKEIENLGRKAWQNSANPRCNTCCSACRWHSDWPQIRQLGAGLTAHWFTERQGRPVRLEDLLLSGKTPQMCGRAWLLERYGECSSASSWPQPETQKEKYISNVLFALRKRQLYQNVDILNLRFRELSIPPPAGLEELIAEYVRSYGVPYRSL